MRLALIAFASSLALAACATAQSPTGAQSPAIAAPAVQQVEITAPSGAYKIDPAHASLLFRVSHLGLSMYTARFNKFDADLTFDAKAPEKSALKVTIDPASVDTGFQTLGREKDFNGEVAKILGPGPITFASTAITRTGATGKVTGDLTMNGVTKPVTLDVTFYGDKVNPFSKKPTLGFAGRGKILRSEWGVDEWIGVGIGDEVEIVIEAEFPKADS